MPACASWLRPCEAAWATGLARGRQQRSKVCCHQRDKRHKPEPQHIALCAHTLQHLANHKRLARSRGRAQQTRWRRDAQQRRAYVVDQLSLKSLGLQGRPSEVSSIWVVEFVGSIVLPLTFGAVFFTVLPLGQYFAQ
jgi:hypothetical protein